jgi:cytochrome c biogenesis protein CcdA
VINILSRLFPKFPIKLKIPTVSHKAMGRLMERASFPAAFGLGLLVGICQFPCMGGPYLMVIGLLKDQVTYLAGSSYLVLYNFVLIIPLVAVLWITANQNIVNKMQEWKKTNIKGVKFWAGVAMIIIGILIFFI